MSFVRYKLIFFLILASFACLNNAVCAENVAQGVRVIVIDAGHGGPKYPGAKYGNVCEKDINLKVALKLGALIEKNLPEIKVIYTRKTEKQFSANLAEDLQARADIANKADGDLFISIHSNASRDNKVHGTETLIMGESSIETSRNSDALFDNNKEELIDMSDSKQAAIVRAYIQNLQTSYGMYSEAMARFMQKHYVKAGRSNRGVRKQLLKVLYSTDMPSVLTEIGFMSNAEEFRYINSDKGQNEIASSLFAAVKDYVAYVRQSLMLDGTAEAAENVSVAVEETKPSVETVAAEPAKPAVAKYSFAIQITASAKSVATTSSEFKSYKGKVKEYKGSGKFPYKYCVGEYADMESAKRVLPEVRKTFPGAYVVKISDNKIVK